MGKQGPCYHCGVTSTPLWRNGPPEKPILCNACGSRWRTKGTLVNYTPLHARSEEADEFEDHRITKTKALIPNQNKLKRKDKGVDEDISNNRSCSGSAISNSDSCIMQQLCSADASDLIGPTSQSSVVWDRDVIMVPPSRKRRCQLSVEKLTQDLYTILHEQQSYFSGSSEEQEDLIFESETPMVSVEIGHGSVLIHHPNNTVEESEATSLSFHGKDLYNRDNDGKLLILTNHNSPLCYMDLRDIVNFDVFANHMTNDEQQQLVKYLPPIDSAQLPNSLKSMFDSPDFVENLCSFQKLLAEGSLISLKLQ